MFRTILGNFFLVIGTLFIFLGLLGVFRMPDIFNRIQAGTKAITLGFLSIITGTIIFMPEWWPKLIIIAIFVLITNPIASHNIARAAYKKGDKKIIAKIDKYSGK